MGSHRLIFGRPEQNRENTREHHRDYCASVLKWSYSYNSPFTWGATASCLDVFLFFDHLLGFQCLIVTFEIIFIFTWSFKIHMVAQAPPSVKVFPDLRLHYCRLDWTSLLSSDFLSQSDIFFITLIKTETITKLNFQSRNQNPRTVKLKTFLFNLF